MIERAALSWSDAPAPESQDNTTKVDVANELKDKDINNSPFDVTPANPKGRDTAPTERPPISDHETASRGLDTDKFTKQQPEKEGEAAVQSIPRGPAMYISLLGSTESRPTQELVEHEQDSTSVQNDRPNQKCQSGKVKCDH